VVLIFYSITDGSFFAYWASLWSTLWFKLCSTCSIWCW
jgi:hypothetical protein